MNRLVDNFLNQLVGVSNPQLVISSNITPDITVDLSKLLVPGTQPAVESSQAVTANNKLLLQLMQPEITFTSLGAQKTIAPYGRPIGNVHLFLLLGIGAFALTGSMIAWKLCRSIGN